MNRDLTMLRLLIAGKSLQTAADAIGLDQRATLNAAKQYGYPDLDTMRRALGKIEESAGAPCEHDQLLDWATGHARKPVRRLRERAVLYLELLAKERKEAEEELARQERTRAEREVAEADIVNLERQLAQAKSKLRHLKANGHKKPTQVGEVIKHNSAQVRAWARDNGVQCPTHGRIPRDVLERWQAAQTGAAT